jgi:hypothetical protein
MVPKLSALYVYQLMKAREMEILIKGWECDSISATLDLVSSVFAHNSTKVYMKLAKS